MKKIITPILLMLFMGCEESVAVSLEEVKECIECADSYHFDDHGDCVCD